MLFDPRDDTALYQALLDKNVDYDGRVFVCVTTTGIFCRLSCPARKPKRENCQFHDTVSACIEAGYRPCKRCHPLELGAERDPIVRALLSQLDAQPDHRWRAQDVAALGYDTSTVRRVFKRHFGMTFLEMARQRRLRDGFTTLAEGGSVIAAQQDSGFESASAFRAAFARLLGIAPGAFHKDPMLWADWIATPLGDMIAVCSQTHVHLLEFADRKALRTEIAALARHVKGRIGIGSSAPARHLRSELAAYFDGVSSAFDTPIAFSGSAFAQSVWRMLMRIPVGETRSYSEIAQALGRPDATRAVARANGANQLALIVPCHRVIGADGALTGYGGGLWRKQRLLDIEHQFRTSQQERVMS